jgi:2-keto-4-pentenoate hydratase/2-oxohepta-3-ene-1,7-dioic acid hydratase in catechol pathway
MKIFCIGRNYAEHAKEMNSDVPGKPMVFMKPDTAVNTSDTMDYPTFTRDMHHEIEILLFIDKAGNNIPVNRAHEHFSDIGLGIDFTARDIQSQCKEKGHPWEISKAFDRSAYIGARYSKQNFDMNDIRFRLDKNGEPVQAGTTADLIFDFNTLIAYISTYFTLAPGDIIFTGTPEGVGPVVPGDKLEGYIGDELSLKLSINRE